MLYLLTFTCYGTHLHGAASGSFERRATGTRHRPAHPGLEAAMRSTMVQEPYALTAAHRPIVLEAIKKRSAHRNWQLLAIHVRSTHIHAIVDTPADASQALTAIKAAASEALNQAGFETPDRRRWTRHGSTRTLTSATALDRAIHYLVHGQGDPMSLYVAPRTG
jgi:REP element-mobilizing transposase RayT